MGEPTETDALIPHGQQASPNVNSSELTPKLQVYKSRWYILIVYSLVALTQGSFWNTFGPIANSCQVAFGWQEADIALLQNWGAITYILGVVPLTLILDKKGLRVAALLCASLCLTCAILRAITTTPPAVTWLMHISNIVNGFGGPLGFAGPPLVSAVWFPANERATATGLGATSGILGTAMSFLVGPLIVKETQRQNSSWCNVSGAGSNQSWIIGGNCTENVAEQRAEIAKLAYVELAWIGVIFIIILVYFPAKPPTPPSISASVERVDYLTSIKEASSKWAFWCVALSFGISVGTGGGWAGLLDVNVRQLKDCTYVNGTLVGECIPRLSQEDAGWMGFGSITGGCVATVFIGRLADLVQGRMKIFLLVLMLCSTGAIAWFCLLCGGFIPYDRGSIFTACILGGIFMNGGTSLYYELSCELAYPGHEGVAAGFLTVIYNIFALIFLTIPMIPSVGEDTRWMNWCLLGASAITLPLLAAVKERYGRMEVDQLPQPVDRTIHVN